MDISPSDKVIDPACGTGGFLLESYRQLRESVPTMSDGDAKGWAQRHLYGVDKDRINIKLTKAIMLTIGDGSTHTFLGDSLRKHLWPKTFQDLQNSLKPNSSLSSTQLPTKKNVAFALCLSNMSSISSIFSLPQATSKVNATFLVGS